jgi:hypothetical protein
MDLLKSVRAEANSFDDFFFGNLALRISVDSTLNN